MALSPPPEIWWLILRLATRPSTVALIDYTPFESGAGFEEAPENQLDERGRLQTCVSLMRVSKLIRAISAEFLYEIVQILDEGGLRSFMLGLQTSRSVDDPHGFGKFVRCVELLKRPTAEITPDHGHSLLPHPHPIYLRDIFGHCPFIEVFIRPQSTPRNLRLWASLASSPIEGASPVLPCLKRLEWRESQFDTFLAESVSRLKEIVAHSPQLQYLDLSSDRPDALTDLGLPPTLTTLRLGGSQPTRQPAPPHSAPRTPEIPSLRYLILDTLQVRHASLQIFLAGTGRTIRTVEFSFSPQAQISAGHLKRLLRLCPNIEELSYFPGAPDILAPPGFQHPPLKRVRLRVGPIEWDPPRYVLQAQFDVLTGPLFSGLQELVLDDEARWLSRKPWGARMLVSMTERGCTVIYADGAAE
ncbi:hypothetical protein DFH09DRAFT_1333594 [Mycena vulgaris]|nr:hypothetical protein DFH09DRAFT_1333594 [Mycena vulgaris]